MISNRIFRLRPVHNGNCCHSVKNNRRDPKRHRRISNRRGLIVKKKNPVLSVELFAIFGGVVFLNIVRICALSSFISIVVSSLDLRSNPFKTHKHICNLFHSYGLTTRRHYRFKRIERISLRTPLGIRGATIK